MIKLVTAEEREKNHRNYVKYKDKYTERNRAYSWAHKLRNKELKTMSPEEILKEIDFSQI